MRVSGKKPINGTVEGNCALLSIHSWLVRHEGMTILIDTGAGNDKSRPRQMVLDHLKNPFLERLADAGVNPDPVDYVAGCKQGWLLKSHLRKAHRARMPYKRFSRTG
jgi:hypothetical protein